LSCANASKKEDGWHKSAGVKEVLGEKNIASWYVKLKFFIEKNPCIAVHSL